MHLCLIPILLLQNEFVSSVRYNSSAMANKIILSKKQVAEIARLARITVSQKELEQFAPQLSEIVSYFDQLKMVNTDNVAPTIQFSKDENRFQEQSLDADRLSNKGALQNAKRTKDGYIVTDQVIK